MAAEKIVVEIRLDDLGVARGEHGMTFAGYVADLAAGRIIESVARERWAGDLKRRVEELRDEQILEAIRPIVARALEEAAQPTDAWGKPKGDPTSLRDLVLGAAREALKATHDSHGSQKRRTLLEEVIEVQVQAALRKELKGAVDEARQAVLDAVSTQAAEIIKETIARSTRA